MSQEVNVVVNQMRRVVEAIQMPDGFFAEGESIHYTHGHAREIAIRLSKKLQVKEKYPLIILMEDFRQRVYGNVNHLNLTVLIVGFTKKEYWAEDRYTNVIVPKLMPIYMKFLQQLSMPKAFFWEKDKNGSTLPPHDMEVHPYYGVTEQDRKAGVKNLMNDPLDVIEISNLEINTKFITC